MTILPDASPPGQFSRVPFHVDITAMHRSELVTYLTLMRACWAGRRVTTGELSQASRLDRATVARALRELIARGVIQREGRTQSPHGCAYRFEGVHYPAQSTDGPVSGRLSCDPQITSSTETGRLSCDPQITSLVIRGSQARADTDPYLDILDPSPPPSRSTHGHIGQPAKPGIEGSDLSLRVQDHLRRGCDSRYSVAEIDRVIRKARDAARSTHGVELSDADVLRHSDQQTDDKGLRRARSPLHAMLGGHRLAELCEGVAARQSRARERPARAAQPDRSRSINAAAAQAALASLKR